MAGGKFLLDKGRARQFLPFLKENRGKWEPPQRRSTSSSRVVVGTSKRGHVAPECYKTPDRERPGKHDCLSIRRGEDGINGRSRSFVETKKAAISW